MLLHKKQARVSVLLCWIILVCSKTAFAQSPFQMLDDDDNSEGRTATASNGKSAARQLGFLIALASRAFLPPQSQLKSIQNARLAIEDDSDRSVLGVANGTLVPIPGAVDSCVSSVGAVFDPLGSYVLTTDGTENVVCAYRTDQRPAIRPQCQARRFPQEAVLQNGSLLIQLPNSSLSPTLNRITSQPFRLVSTAAH